MSVSRNSQAINLIMSGFCFRTITCQNQQASHCRGEVFDAVDPVCGTAHCTGGNAGTRNCDTNLREVAP